MSCPDCFTGGVSTQTPTGKETTIHGLPTYVAQPPEGVTPKALVVFIPDAFGWNFVNNRVLADIYARKGGYLVYLPDFMNGWGMTPTVIGLMESVQQPSSWFDTIAYKPFRIGKLIYHVVPFLLHANIGKTHPRVVAYFQALRSSLPPFATDDLKIGAAGFCWGAKHTFLLLHDPESIRVKRHESQKVVAAAAGEALPLVDCGFTAHPSFIKVPDDVERIKLPLSVSVGDQDAVMKEPQARRTKEILDAKEGGRHEVTILPGAKHGFAIRTHPDDKEELEFADQAEQQALAWFNKWLVAH